MSFHNGNNQPELDRDARLHGDLDDKDTVQYVEDERAKYEAHALATMPESLRGLTNEDLVHEQRKMVRKMDMIIMPIIAILYILNYIDRQNLAAAKLQGIVADLGLSSQEYATAISILYVGYVPFQIPSNLLISRISRPGLYICFAVVLWGGISACTAAVKTYQQLLVVRVFLGVSEAVFFPGVVYYLSAWYTKSELGKRIAGLYIGQQLGNAFGPLIAAGLGRLNGVHGIEGWRWLFIVEGSATVGIGALCALIMPEYPHNARILSPMQQNLAVWRLEKEAVLVWALVWAMMMVQTMGSINNFFPTIVATLHFSSTNTLLLSAPPYLLAALYFYGMTWYSDKSGKIFMPLMVCCALAVIAYVIALATLTVGARYFAMMLLPSGVIGPQLLLYKTVNLHIARPYPKRAAAVAMMNSIGGTAPIWASYLYVDGPHYYVAFGCLLAATVVFLITIIWYKFYVVGQNTLLSGSPDQQKEAIKRGVTQEQVQLGWRYVGY